MVKVSCPCLRNSAVSKVASPSAAVAFLLLRSQWCLSSRSHAAGNACALKISGQRQALFMGLTKEAPQKNLGLQSRRPAGKKVMSLRYETGKANRSRNRSRPAKIGKIAPKQEYPPISSFGYSFPLSRRDLWNRTYLFFYLGESPHPAF